VGRTLYFHFGEIHTEGTNAVISRGVGRIPFDGYGAEACWACYVDPSSFHRTSTRVSASGMPTGDGSAPNAARRCRSGGHRK
jgi:hypothetical protein